MKNRIVLALVLLLMVTVLPVSAAQNAPAAAQSGPQAAQFRDLHAQMNAILAQLAKLRNEYRTAKEDRRTEIQQEYKEVIAKGEKIEPKLIDAAEKAYQEAPNADKELTKFLLMLMAEKVHTDDYEPAARIGKLLMDNKCDEEHVPNLAGIAAFAVSDFASAEKYLTAAESKGDYKSISKEDKLAATGQMYLQLLPYYKPAWAKEKSLRAREAKADDLPRVLLKTSKGDIEIELFEDQAPNTVANFISLVQSGFYKDVTFHRVIKGFMAQGGDPTGSGSGGPGYSIACECYRPDHRVHFRGTLSMAHAGRDTGGSQFFLTFVPTPHLDGKHTAFGRVISGMDVLSKLQARSPDDREAARPDKILDAKVIRKRPHPYKPEKMPE
jgi:cyclophilin family peptidyl-prolyl cis-trans isomerase